MEYNGSELKGDHLCQNVKWNVALAHERNNCKSVAKDHNTMKT